MEIHKFITGEVHELRVSGRIDGEGANRLEEEVLKTMRAGAKSILVNLSEATFLCSAGLRVLLQYWRQMKNSQRSLLATRPSPEVDAVLGTSGFRELIVEKMWAANCSPQVEILLTNRPGDRQRAVQALETFSQQHQLPAPVQQAADLALEEHLTNITRYAFEDGHPHEILVRLEVEQNDLLVEVEDCGKPFDPLQKPEVDTSVPLESKPVGGLGIHLIRQFMDDVRYRRENGRNILTMRKRVSL